MFAQRRPRKRLTTKDVTQTISLHCGWERGETKLHLPASHLMHPSCVYTRTGNRRKRTDKCMWVGRLRCLRRRGQGVYHTKHEAVTSALISGRASAVQKVKSTGFENACGVCSVVLTCEQMPPSYSPLAEVSPYLSWLLSPNASSL